MSVVLIRSVILYILVIFAVRLMGKRQLGELQPSELVITILVSNIATLPVEDVDIPMIVGITPILALVCFEVMVSWVTLRFPAVRRLVSGSPKIIISNGTIDYTVMRELRFSVDDLTMALRGQGVFDLAEVQFAIVETTGNMSVMRKQSNESPTRADLAVAADVHDPPHIVISDGRIITAALSNTGLSEEKVTKILSSAHIRQSEVLLMTAGANGDVFIAPRSGKAPVIITGGKK